MTREPTTFNAKRKLSEHFVLSDTEEEEEVIGIPVAKRRRSSPDKTKIKTYFRNKQIPWNPTKECLCKLIGPISCFDHDNPLGYGVKRLVEAASDCAKHNKCCASCQPSCHGPLSPDCRNTSVQPLDRHLLEDLHPVPQNWLPRDSETLSKKEKRMYEEQAWRIHCGLIRKLEVDPYRYVL